MRFWVSFALLEIGDLYLIEYISVPSNPYFFVYKSTFSDSNACGWLLGDGKRHSKNSSASGVVFRINLSAMGFDNGSSDIQAQAHPFTFGCKKGLKNAGQVFRGDAVAGVLH